MIRCLNTNMIGVEATPIEAVRYASDYGFGAVDLSIPAVAGADNDAKAAERLAAEMREADLVAGAGLNLLPGKVSVEDAEWQDGMKGLDDRLRIAEKLGVTRTMIVMLPFHDTMEYNACLDLHVRRLGEAASKLEGAGVRIGIEYVSQLTRRAGHAHEFIFDLDGTLELIDRIGAPNLGVVLDSFHWHCAGETAKQVTGIPGERAVICHASDAVAGRPVEEQVAFERELPGATGEIDLPGFLDALRSIGFDGPVTAEPMNQALREMPDDKAIRAVASAMDSMGV